MADLSEYLEWCHTMPHLMQNDPDSIICHCLVIVVVRH